MRYIMLMAVAGIGGLLCAPAAAGKDKPIVVVLKAATLASWSNDVTRKINQHLFYPAPVFNSGLPTGLVSVRFTCARDGSTSNIVLYRKSGTASLDRAAMRAVTRMKPLGPMPSSLGDGRNVLANIIFASSQEDLDNTVRAMRRDVAQNANARADDGVMIALNIGSHGQAGM